MTAELRPYVKPFNLAKVIIIARKANAPSNFPINGAKVQATKRQCILPLVPQVQRRDVVQLNTV